MSPIQHKKEIISWDRIMTLQNKASITALKSTSDRTSIDTLYVMSHSSLTANHCPTDATQKHLIKTSKEKVLPTYYFLNVLLYVRRQVFSRAS